jgi:hypothetical protein
MSRKALVPSLRVVSTVLVAATLYTSCAPPEYKFDEEDAPVGGSGGAMTQGGKGGSTQVVPDAGMGGEGGTPAPVDHCETDKTDADESDVDCGGADCAVCKVGWNCNADSDCANGKCTLGICRDPTCMDELKDASETDVDCGGGSCPPCDPEQACIEPSDCLSEVCKGGECQAPTCSDRVKNGDEVDVDCSGSCPNLCEPGQTCVLDADCVVPPDPESEAIVCDNDVCVLKCGSGKEDCDSSAVNGCETFIKDDPDHCGGCDLPCDPDNASGQCSGGNCEVATCSPGYENCDGLHDNGCEINLNGDPDHCGSCATDCSDQNGADGCSGGNCNISCNVGFDDCDDDLSNGCETNTDINSLHCGGCSNGFGQNAAGIDCPNGSSNQSPYCSDGICGLTDCVTPGTGDCDGNGTCTDDLTTVNNCGGCGLECVINHNTPICDDSAVPDTFECRVGTCAQDATNKWEDCNGSPSDGCERDLYNDAGYCGTCGTSCLTKVGTQNVTGVACDGSGGCAVTSCATGYADCDGLFATGCEVQKSEDDQNCGGCSTGGGGGINCTTLYPHASGSCTASACSMGNCNADYGNCMGGIADGCETNIQTTSAHCGGCNMPCLTNSVTSVNACSNGSCSPTCSGAGENCDSNARNGCEDKNNDEANCGSCDLVCATPTGTASTTCSTGSCSPTCSAPSSQWQECDGNGANGCENKLVDDNNCGVCDRVCDESPSAHVTATGNNCDTGVCEPACASGYDNCDSEPWDGCETNINTSSTHCGGCNITCGGNQTNVATASCNGSGVCTVTCNGGMCPNTSDAERPCTAPLGTTSNCTSCGETCAGQTPLCTPSGCNDHYPIVLHGDTDGNGTGDVVSVNHTLQNGSGKHRLVVVGVATAMNPTTGVITATYNGVAMTSAGLLRSDNGGGADGAGSVAILYLKDANLPANTGTYSVAVDRGTETWGGVLINILELTNVNQTTPVDGTAVTTREPVDCPGDTDISHNVPISGEDNLIYSVMVTMENVAGSATPSNQTELLDQYRAEQATGYMGYKIASTAQVVGWTGVTACWDRTLLSVAFNSRTN